MKKKTEAIVYILIIFIIALIISGIIVFAKRNEPKKENIALEAYEIANVEEVSKDIPEFKVEIIGDYEGLLDNNILKEKNIKMYQFDAGISNGNQTQTAKYTGFKLADILDAIDIYEYSSLEFKSDEDYSSVVNEANDKSFIVFMKNEKEIDISLLLVDKPYYKSVQNVTRIFVGNDHTFLEDKS